MGLFDWLHRLVDAPRVEPRPTTSVPTTPASLKAELENQELSSPRRPATVSRARPIVFDPALIPASALRPGEPRFAREQDERLWYSSRLLVLHHILTAIAESDWREHLLLRGSAVMASWFGDQARRPGDLDWVVCPADWRFQGAESKRLMKGVIQAIAAEKLDGGLSIQTDSVATESIWTYERAPGVRIIVPWRHADSRFDGTIQMDFVFGEHVPTPPVLTGVHIARNLLPVSLRTASPEQSLAWKLLWLATDRYAMGKDLYDAVLLAEKYPVSAEIIRETFSAAGNPAEQCAQELSPSAIQEWHIEWDDFIKEYPEIEGTADHWKQRLLVALAPLISELSADANSLQ